MDAKLLKPGKHKLSGIQSAMRRNGSARPKSRLDFVISLRSAIGPFAIDRQAQVAFVALLALAWRGIEPEGLKSGPAGAILRHLARVLFQKNNLLTDSSDFAFHLTGFLRDCNGLDVETLTGADCVGTLADRLEEPSAEAALSDPLLTGWAYQAILMDSLTLTYDRLRQSRSIDGLELLTQWFTPAWISDFLVGQCLGSRNQPRLRKSETNTFLDGSVGAGHILVPAFQRLIERDEIGKVLSDELFGIDLDPYMAELSGFALYLACLDRNGVAPWPIPHIYWFDRSGLNISSKLEEPADAHGASPVREQKGGENYVDEKTANAGSFAGSLLLALEPRPDIRLNRLDGTSIALSALPSKFDAQASNPPYLSHRLMPKEMAAFLRFHYFGSHYDLYAAFLELGIRLMADGGKLAFICQQSFLTTTRYESLRAQLLARCRILSLAQLGSGSFASRAGEKVNNAIIVLTRSSRSEKDERQIVESESAVSVYKMISRQDKLQAESSGITALPELKVTEKALLAASQAIPGTPIAPFCPEEIWHLFRDLPPLESKDSGVVGTNGLFTCDNKRFLKHFQEVAEDEREAYVPYDKGGGQKWFSTTPHLLHWKNDGDEIRKFRAARGQARALPGERFYFKNGITYSYIGTKGFKARLLSPGSIFDIASSALFSSRINLYYLLGFLNSSLVRFILGTLNPTVNFQIGDLRRIPFRAPSTEIESSVASLSENAVHLAREVDELNCDSPRYKGPVLERFCNENRLEPVCSNDRLEPVCTKGAVLEHVHNSAPSLAELEQGYSKLTAYVDSINARENELQKEIDDKIYDLYMIPEAVRVTIERDEWVRHGHDGLFTLPSFQAMKKSRL